MGGEEERIQVSLFRGGAGTEGLRGASEGLGGLRGRRGRPWRGEAVTAGSSGLERFIVCLESPTISIFNIFIFFCLILKLEIVLIIQKEP